MMNGLSLAVLAQNKSYEDGRSAYKWDDLNEGEQYSAEQICSSALVVLTAERDRLAAENAELRELVARMKAESLCVVVDTQRGYHYMTPSGIGWNSEDKSGNPCVETPTDYHDFADCKPVRLERWEAEPHDKYAGKKPHDVRGWSPDQCQ